MAGRLPSPKNGKLVQYPPSGFPLFFDKRKPRVVTADPWAFFTDLAREHLKRDDEAKASAYIEQAFDFFQAAQNPHTGSKPILYYYSFLNLAKTALLVHGVDLPPKVTHGISDPKANNRERLRLEG